jgi:dUTP pyrophosphatase
MVKFEKVNRIAEEIRLPERSTLNSAGYDFFAVEDAVFPAKKLTRVMTGVKCELMPDMVLILANRSSNPSKKGLILANGVGVIDADYYGNPDNDGHFYFAYFNCSDHDIEVKKGDAIGQVVFQKYLTVDNDNATGTRVGGFGSTSK